MNIGDRLRLKRLEELERIGRELLDWEKFMGGFEAPAWQRLRDLLTPEAESDEDYDPTPDGPDYKTGWCQCTDGRPSGLGVPCSKCGLCIYND